MRYVSKAEVAEMLQCHPCTVMRLVKRGMLPAPVRFGPGGSLLRFHKEGIERALAALNAAHAQSAAEQQPATA
jgi:excisionase family DNA binding protein